jgi:hypothetical protein
MRNTALIANAIVVLSGTALAQTTFTISDSALSFEVSFVFDSGAFTSGSAVVGGTTYNATAGEGFTFLDLSFADGAPSSLSFDFETSDLSLEMNGTAQFDPDTNPQLPWDASGQPSNPATFTLVRTT